MEIDDTSSAVHAQSDNDFREALERVVAHRPWRLVTDLEKDESAGVLKYEFVTNDGKENSLIDLVHCKCLFGRQLPKMPKEYIVRLVFDRRHICLVMKRRQEVAIPSSTPSGSKTPSPEEEKTIRVQDVVVGAVCFRLFGSFAEIAFLAVSSKEQVRGYGTRLMNQLKEALKHHGITDLVTYADNAAVGYFAKQGFYSPTASQATKSDSEWHTCIKTGYDGYIKDYDGANKMVCCIYKSVDYLRLQEMRVECTSALWQVFLTKSTPVRHKGLEMMPKRIFEVPGLEHLAPPEENEEPPRSRRSTPRPESPPRQRPVPSRLQVPTSIEAMVSDVIETALSNGSSWPFRDPVDVSLAPDYYQVIRHPMDLSTMKSKNQKNIYRTLDEVRSDFRLMFENCLFYNGDESVYAHAAGVLERAVMQRLDRLEAMAGHK